MILRFVLKNILSLGRCSYPKIEHVYKIIKLVSLELIWEKQKMLGKFCLLVLEKFQKKEESMRKKEVRKQKESFKSIRGYKLKLNTKEWWREEKGI